MGRWNDFLRAAPPGGHGVHVAASADELARSVASYLHAGLEAGEPGLVVTPPALRALVEERLDAAERERMTWLDAEETLDSFVVDGALDAERFATVVGGALDAVSAGAGGARVRAYGDMVDVLVRRGSPQLALDLEQLWTALGQTRDFVLLCGYELDVFDADVAASVLPGICRAHTHVRTVADATRLSGAVDQALGDILGPHAAAEVYLGVTDDVPLGKVGRGQAVLLWLARTRPRDARRVLTRTRALYARG